MMDALGIGCVWFSSDEDIEKFNPAAHLETMHDALESIENIAALKVYGKPNTFGLFDGDDDLDDVTFYSAVRHRNTSRMLVSMVTDGAMALLEPPEKTGRVAMFKHWRGYECAITLAGAAEGILPDTNEPHFRRKLLELSKSPEIKGSGGASGPNDYINWLKHGSIKHGGPRIENATIPPLESVAVVWRAITKFRATYDDFSPQMFSFHAWAKEWIVKQ